MAANMFSTFKHLYRFSTEAKATRKEFALFYLSSIVVIFVAAMVGALFTALFLQSNPFLTGVMILAFLLGLCWIYILQFAAIAARCRDLGQSGWMALLTLVPLINVFFLLYILFAPSARPLNQASLEPAPTAAPAPSAPEAAQSTPDGKDLTN